ncbi:MAG: hypothetical protein ACKVK6_10335, partial [bacterium]
RGWPRTRCLANTARLGCRRGPLMDFSVDSETRQLIEQTRELGETEFRPAGIEADRRGGPIAVGDPFFDRCVARDGPVPASDVAPTARSEP